MSNSFTHCIRQIDVDAFTALATDQRYSQRLLDRTTGADRVAVSVIATPPGEGSPEGLHTHTFEQIFYVLRGTMSVEIEAEQYVVSAGSLVIFPEGVPHRNWNSGAELLLHLAINAPVPILETQDVTTG